MILNFFWHLLCNTHIENRKKLMQILGENNFGIGGKMKKLLVLK